MKIRQFLKAPCAVALTVASLLVGSLAVAQTPAPAATTAAAGTANTGGGGGGGTAGCAAGGAGG